MSYNFIPKSRLERYSTSADGMFSPFMMLSEGSAVSKKIISGIELIDTDSYDTLTANNTIQYFASATGEDFAPYKNMLTHLFDNQLDLSSLDANTPTTIVNIQSIGDGIKHNSVTLSLGSGPSVLTDIPYTNKAKNVGCIVNTADIIGGYILYNYGIIILFGSAFVISEALWDSSLNSYIQHSINMDTYEFKYNCYFPEEKNLMTVNNTFYNAIDITDESVTSALTSFWSAHTGWSDYTVAANANDFIDMSDLADINLYITQIGLYDSDNNCLAVASVNRPFKFFENIDLTFKVRLLM
jgi:hypothetical protein